MSAATARAATAVRPNHSNTPRDGSKPDESGPQTFTRGGAEGAPRFAGSARVLRPVAAEVRGRLVEIKTIGDALRLAEEWRRHSEQIEREARGLRAQLAEALADVKTLRDRVDGLEPAALAFLSQP